MGIVSLNAWGGRLHAPLMRYIADADPDILCLQEVSRTASAPSEWLVYREPGLELPQRANLLQEVSAALPDHNAFFFPAARGDLFDGDRLIASEFGLATFVRKSHPVIGQSMDFVHGAFAADGWGEHPRSRNAHGVRIFDYELGFPVTIVQLHGLRDLAGKGDTPARIEQANKLVELIGRVWRKGERLIVCGDFNVLPDSVTFEALGRLGLTDLVTSLGYTDTRTSFYRKEGRFADYMLVTPDVEIAKFEVVEEPEVSDHRALHLEMR
ncbi:metal-dependent hydrolase [Rhizobium tubonense]|uniref:Metal-dependent hydrolase n=1 Tax=Rhizobium tubonense TaxID=484088 RepID=A0A2W4CE04_9HYPH|nr:metal-dependent hydrolase [Rhizobium tubonense]